MKKIVLIGWKDLTLVLRDRTALLFMLAAPFALTLGLGFITGRLSGSGSTGVSGIPVVLVNQDEGRLGNELVDLCRSEELAGLLAPAVVEDPGAARQQVDANQAVAAVIIPAGFTQSIIPAQGAATAGDVVQILLYANPTRPTGASVVRSIVDGFVSRVEIGRAGAEVVVGQLARHGLVGVEDAARIGAQIGAPHGDLITLRHTRGSGEAVDFDALAYMAPGMALMFLMFTASNGGRTLLAERAQGTLPRLLISPTRASQVLAGKVLGIYLTGVVQMLILIVASMLLFRLNWGHPLAVLALVLAAVVGASGWGLLITALARTPGQVSTVGSAIMLTFGILSGTFISLDNMPRWFVMISRITPNAWGVEGFTTLAMGARPAHILGPVTALLGMGAALFAIAVFIYRRRGIAQP